VQPQPADVRQENYRQTYLGLRYGMIVLAAMLYIGVLLQWLIGKCYQDSVSAYYFTPVRPVLIGALTAIGTGLVIYRGNTSQENRILDAAGFLAIVVAFVPTETPAPNTGCNASDGLLSSQLAGQLDAELAARIEAAYAERLDNEVVGAIGVSILALIAAGTIAILLGGLVKSPHSSPGFDLKRTLSSSAFSLGLLVAGFILYRTFDRATFRLIAHPFAAVAFFLLILIVICLNARSSDTPPRYRTFYRDVILVTLAAMVGTALLRIVVDYAWIFWLETVGIFGFIAFWFVQSRELGGLPNRTTLAEKDPKN